jgi:hypothetical protein
MAALLVGVAVALNKQTMTAWVGPEHFAGYMPTFALGVAAWVMTVTNLGNQVLIAHGEIEKPAKAFFAFGIVKFAVAAVAVRALGLVAFPLAAILATSLTYSRQLLTMIIGILRPKVNACNLLIHLVRSFGICLSLAVAHWQLQPSFGNGWGALVLGGAAILLFMLSAVAVLARQEARDLYSAIAQGVAHVFGPLNCLRLTVRPLCNEKR